MTPTTASMGHQAKLGTKNETIYGSAVTVDQGFVFTSESIVKRGVIVERAGLRGTRSHRADDTRVGPYAVGGRLVLEPTPEDLAIWLPRILGADPNGTTYDLDETLPSFSLSIDRVAKVFIYAGCKVNRATFRGAQGGLLRLTLDIVAQSETVAAAGTFPSLSPSVSQPYIFSDLALTLASTAREVKEFELVIDNGVMTDRFMNSLVIVNAPEGDRTITLQTMHAWASENTNLYAQALAGAAGTLQLTNALGGTPPTGYRTTFSFATLQVPDRSPNVPGRDEFFLNLEMVARQVGGTPELTVTHDSTP
ncbi:MAG: phage tail tube protein [Pirellulales bacterium]